MNDCIHPRIKSDISIVVRDADIKRTVDIRCSKKSARYALSELKKTHGVDVFFHDWKLVVQKAFKHPNLTFASKGNQSKPQKQKTSESKEKFPIFRFTWNIIEDDLTPQESKPFQIIVRGENPKTGQTYRGVHGEGEARYYEIDGLDSEGAEKRAKEIFDDKCGSGFKGKFISFGYPSITHSQIVDIQDPEDSSRSAKAFVDRVIKKFNTKGYRQEIYPGLYHEPPRTGSSKSSRKNKRGKMADRTIIQAIVQAWKIGFPIFFPKLGIVDSVDSEKKLLTVKVAEDFIHNVTWTEHIVPRVGSKCLLIARDNIEKRYTAFGFEKIDSLKTKVADKVEVEINENKAFINYNNLIKVTLDDEGFLLDLGGKPFKIRGNIEQDGDS